MKTPEHIYRSYEEAADLAPKCCACGTQTVVNIAVSFSYTSFRPFVTTAFGKTPLDKPVEVSDRAQLRDLLRSNRMVEQGDFCNYFGSDPRSVPTFEEVCKFGKSGGDPRLAKLVKVGTQEDMKKFEAAAEQTDFGRRTAKVNPEYVVRP